MSWWDDTWADAAWIMVRDPLRDQFWKPDTNARSVGASGPAEGFVPIWGSGRTAVDAFQNGRYGSGVLNGGLAALDLLLVGRLLHAGKAALTGLGAGGLRAGAVGGEAVVGAGLTEFRVGAGLLREGGWLDRWARFWKYDRTAETTMSEGRSILGGLWTLGKLDRLVIRDARYSLGWFDALAHEGVHILSGTVLWPVKLFINNNPSGRFFFGWVKFAEEIAAYNVGRLAVGRIHGMGPLAVRDAVRSLRATDSMFALRSAGFALPFEIALGYYLYQKFPVRR